ncbi:hypothetical protein V4V56_003775 [Vibrio mimicus]|uniref:hypothetical protein n=1 Tax=Vibrio mimicus TaxID=674 RepID=UPI0011DC32F3|nr:hypothetical protein [Vibrio mimicus]TXY45700.1 hypothetical protein FXE78_13135 [Vibrio mimicus]HAS3612492.1 hypothetical protein [Vibrio cholerae]
MKKEKAKALVVAGFSAFALVLCVVFKNYLPEYGLISGQAFMAALLAVLIYSILEALGIVKSSVKKKS